MKLGFIGSGKMATALVQGVIKSGIFRADEITITDALPEAAAQLSKSSAVKSCASNVELAASAETILLCVKPADVAAALRETKGVIDGKLVISIVAGVTLATLRKFAPRSRLVRVMPNTPALIHKGAAAFAPAENATPSDAELTEKIFASVGTAFRVKEDLLDAVTGLSGSGPAYVYVVIEALADAAVLMGLPRDLALQLSAQTVAGAAEMVLQTGMHPAQLKDLVTSPGGTTIAGLEALENAAVRSAFLAAVRAATERSRELGAAD